MLGRQILHASLIANEAVDLQLKWGERGLHKLDIEKTYDHVNWKFLLEVLRKLGERWLCWINCSISMTKLHFLLMFVAFSKVLDVLMGESSFPMPFCDFRGSIWWSFEEGGQWRFPLWLACER